MQASSAGDARPAAPPDHSERPCPIGRAGSLLGDRWTLLILRDATMGVTRFDAFRDSLRIADNVLSSRLRRLVAAGVLTRLPYRDGNRTRHEYRLTPAGADLLPVLRALADWGDRHTRPAEPAPPMRMVHAGCGGDVGIAGTCAGCGMAVSRRDEAWVRPWRSPDPVPLAAPVA
jgi:DNA-binding HxlR family transcriptional regulator